MKSITQFNQEKDTKSLILYLVKELGCLYNRSSREVKAVAISIGGGAYGVKPLKPIR